MVRQLDWAECAWPEALHRKGDFPRAQRYCLMSTEGSWTVSGWMGGWRMGGWRMGGCMGGWLDGRLEDGRLYGRLFERLDERPSHSCATRVTLLHHHVMLV